MLKANFIAPVVFLAAGLCACSAAVEQPASPPGSTNSADPSAGVDPPEAIQSEPADIGETLIAGASGYIFGGSQYLTLIDSGAQSIVLHDIETGAELKRSTLSLDLDIDCGLAVVDGVASGKSLLVGLRQQETPPQGLEEGAIEQIMVATNLPDFTPAWTAVVDTAPNQGSSGGSRCTGLEGGVNFTFRTTADGKFGLYKFRDAPTIINLSDGTTTSEANALSIAGNWVAVGRGDDGTDRSLPTAVELIDPETSAVAGSTTDPRLVLAFSTAASRQVESKVVASPNSQFAAADVPYSGSGDYLGGVLGLTLPDLKKIWEIGYDESRSGIVLTGGGGAVTLPDGGTSRGPYGEQIGVDIVTGVELWEVPSATERCGTYGDAVVLIANSQLVLASATTGEQITFDPSVSSCPSRHGAALAVTAGSSYDVVSLGPRSSR